VYCYLSLCLTTGDAFTFIFYILFLFLHLYFICACVLLLIFYYLYCHLLLCLTTGDACTFDMRKFINSTYLLIAGSQQQLSNNVQSTTHTHTHTHTICKSAPCSREITTPVPHYSVFYRPDALPAAQLTVSKHWRQSSSLTTNVTILIYYRHLETKILPSKVLYAFLNAHQ